MVRKTKIVTFLQTNDQGDFKLFVTAFLMVSKYVLFCLCLPN